MDQRTTSLKFLKSTGLIPVKVRPGQKDPFPEWDPRLVAKEDHSLTLAAIEHEPDLNLGALFSGRYVDVDNDATTPFIHAALDYFLPRTPYVWGRKSKPKSHRVYALQEEFDRGPWGQILRYIKGLVGGQIDDYSYSLEVRGGKPENGLFTVLPGSRIPKEKGSEAKEVVEWDGEIDVTVGGSYVEIDRLIRGIRLAIAAAMIAPHWGPGIRNDMSLALAGTLWRIKTSTRAAYGLELDEDAPVGYFVLTDDDAKALFTCIMKLADDQHGDERQRMLNLINTWKKLDGEAGGKVTGGKVLADLIGPEVGPRVVRALYRLLSDNDAAEQVEKLAEQFVMWYGVGVIVDLHMVAAGRSSPWMTKEQATNSLGGKKLIIGNKKVPLVNMLFGSTIINRVMGLTFDPSTPELLVQTPEGLMVNQWKGWGTEPSTQAVLDEQIEPFLTYIKTIIADGDEERFRWTLAWLADILQNPSRKAGTALVLVGVQGAGKTFLGEHVMAKIIGDSHSVQLNAIEQLTSKFNTLCDNKMFIQCNEAMHSHQRETASRLKSIITDRNMIVEPKGINSYSKPAHFRVCFTSNDETAAVFIDPSPYERRFTVMKVSPSKANDMDYWSFMHLWTPANLPKIMRWLLDYQYERTMIQRPLDTEAKRDVQRVGVDMEVSWILARMASGHPLSERTHHNWFEGYHLDHITEYDKKNNVLRRDVWPNRVVPDMIEADYKDFVRGHGRPVYTGSVITNVKRALPENSLKQAAQMTVRVVDERSGQVRVERRRVYEFPSTDDILAHLRKRYGPVVDKMYEDFKVHPDTEDITPEPDSEEY